MGLRAPFGYVGYEYTMAELFYTVLDKLCAHCHTNDDYQDGCKSCPAGVLIFACRDYVLTAIEQDKHHKQYTTKEWLLRRRKRGVSEEQLEIEKQHDLRFITEYKPEDDLLREMKRTIRGIVPHPFFYIQYNKKRGYERPKELVQFMELASRFRETEQGRLAQWGLSIKPLKV